MVIGKYALLLEKVAWVYIMIYVGKMYFVA